MPSSTGSRFVAKFSEADEAKALIQWRDWVGAKRFPELELLIHIPNGGYRLKREAARFKAMGVRAGVSDYLLPVAKKGYHGLWLELKANVGRDRSVWGNATRTTSAQLEWIDLMQEQGYSCAIAYGWEDAAKILEGYLE